ncbi:MAG: hypothetical protein HN356_09490 [Calditrichaeota bacterium]|nr:hypothetical protein [Calditrichota bacterium]MBT7787478.1 hypothetical protein [Calditrichota bacterium]
MIRESQNLTRGNFDSVGPDDLALLFDKYDELFFNGNLKREFESRISFKLSKRMTRNGGKCSYYYGTKKYSITIAIVLIFATFRDKHREILVNGIKCRDRLEAMMRIFEHELIHLIEHSIYGKSSCSANRFKELSYRIFGHTGVTHRLVTIDELARNNLGLHVGSKVSFNLENRKLKGIIYRITKRATVMVKDKKGEYSNKNGNCYSKYYVPLQNLERR